MKGRAVTLAFQFALLAGAILYGAARGPDRMPLHWGLGGEADRIGSREQWVLETSLLAVGLLVVTGLVVLLVRKAPVAVLNIPNKEYWARPEHTPEARQLVLDDVVDIFGEIVLFVAAVQVFVVFRARSGDLDFPTPVFLIGLAILLLSIGWRLFKMPGRYAAPTRR